MLIRSGLIVAILTFLSRIFGMFRELFIATTFGTSSIADSVNVAFKLPNLFRRILGEGALASVFVPIFTDKLKNSKDQANLFASKVFFWLLILSFTIFIVIEFFMPEIMMLIAPGFVSSPDKFALTVILCRITMVYLLFITLTALVGSMLNSVGRFAPFASTSILMNIVIIGGTIFISNYTENYYAIALSIVVAGILQLAVIIYSAYRADIRISLPKISTEDKDIRKLVKLMVPATISAGALQINLFISQSISSFIPGAVSILSYADRLYQLPMSIIGVSFGTILLPTLSKLYKSHEVKKARQTQETAIKIGFFLTLPCSAALIVLGHPMISLIYEYGAFNHEDAVNTSFAIAAFSLGLPAFVLSKIFMPIFYAHHDTKTPMKITIKTIIANIILNLILMQYYGFIGIALGSSIASWVGVYFSIRYTDRYGYFSLNADLIIYLFKLFFCAMIASITMFCTYLYFSDIFPEVTAFYRAIKVFASLGSGFGIYILLALISGVLGGLKRFLFKSR